MERVDYEELPFLMGSVMCGVWGVRVRGVCTWCVYVSCMLYSVWVYAACCMLARRRQSPSSSPSSLQPEATLHLHPTPYTLHSCLLTAPPPGDESESAIRVPGPSESAGLPRQPPPHQRAASSSSAVSVCEADPTPVDIHRRRITAHSKHHFTLQHVEARGDNVARPPPVSALLVQGCRRRL
jgi:hypothetical protein